VRTASIIALTVEAICTSETSVYFNETARRYIAEGYHLYVLSLLLEHE
jgi:hypothetical protein